MTGGSYIAGPADYATGRNHTPADVEGRSSTTCSARSRPTAPRAAATVGDTASTAARRQTQGNPLAAGLIAFAVGWARRIAKVGLVGVVTAGLVTLPVRRRREPYRPVDRRHRRLPGN